MKSGWTLGNASSATIADAMPANRLRAEPAGNGADSNGEAASTADREAESAPLRPAPLRPAPLRPAPRQSGLSSKILTARALHSYTAETADELDFRKDDTLDIVSDLSKGWWYARRHRGNKFGYVPSNYVLLDNAEVSQHPSWHQIDRLEAEKLLLLPGLPSGVFIIRPSSSGCYALSLRTKHAKKPNYPYVLHFHISITPEAKFYISPTLVFATLAELLKHYSKRVDGMPCKLTRPCPVPVPPPADFADLEVNRDCLALEQKIGQGSFSEVFQAKWNKTVPVAVKMLRSNVSDQQNFIQEAQLLLAAYHPHVLQIMGVCTASQPLYIITELLTNGSLLEYLRQDKGVLLSAEHLVHMMIELADAMSHLESLRIVHRDLRAANILVGDDTAVKLADFGLARQLDESGVYFCQGEKFPARWTPAEAVLKARFSTKSDVWSFGVLMWEIVTYGGHPYMGLQNREVVEFVSKGYRMPNPHGGHVHCDSNLYQIMLECWSSSPERRPSFARLKDILTTYSAVQGAARKAS